MYGLTFRLFPTRGSRRDSLRHVVLGSLAVVMFMLMLMCVLIFLAVLCVMWFLVLWHLLLLGWIRLERGVWEGRGPRRSKGPHRIVKTAGGRSFGLIPWIGLHNSFNTSGPNSELACKSPNWEISIHHIGYMTKTGHKMTDALCTGLSDIVLQLFWTNVPT
ncbi:hypothetical protein EYF80_016437 [Liparis tanakae]|uniref:Uncharacterized protein n=1 Tax=Liparis tanakae TaxID=230148 RepID=A0A4Z2I7H8_9TELE|nr:hypothetical protein EYF80_016437 [Liparis tanakae]